MTLDPSSLSEQIRAEIANEREESFEELKASDKTGAVRKDAGLPNGPDIWGILQPRKRPAPPSLAKMLLYCHRNELGDAELFQYLHRDEYVYDHAQEKWYVFDGIRWVPDKLQKAQREVMEMAELYEKAEYLKNEEAEAEEAKLLKLADDAAESGNTDGAADLKKQAYTLRKRLNKKVEVLSRRAESLRSQRRISSVLASAAQGEDSLGISGAEWHGHPELLPCANGIINLRTGELTAPSPSLFLQHMSPCEYRGIQYVDEFWEEHIDKIMCGDERLKKYLGMALGLSATGYVHKSVFVAYGPASNNGKSVTFDAVKEVLGGFALQLKVSALIDDKRSKNGPNPDLVELANGIRLSVSSENARGEKFRVDILKAISGGDEIRERSLYVENICIHPQCKLWLHTNHIPEMNGYDPAFQNRIKVIPFLAEFTKDLEKVNLAKHIFPEMEKEAFKARMKKAYPGILSYLVRNARDYLRGDDFSPPPAVMEYTSSYMEEQDLVGEYLNICCEKVEGGKIQVKDLYASFKEYCMKEKGIAEKMVKSQKSFMTEIRQRKFEVKISNKSYVLNLVLRESELPLGSVD